MPDIFSKFTISIIIFVLLNSFACRNQNEVNPNLSNEMPPKILWAWERPEDLMFLETDKFGVAFLAQTLILQNDKVIFRPRRQPLEIPAGTYLIAVTRIETVKDEKNRPKLSDEQQKEVVSLIKKTLQLPDVRAVQIDFDVVVSEGEFYRSVVKELKNNLPENVSLTITSLASWCVGDSWFNDFPIDEAVPMAFQMGADDERIRSFLSNGNDWREPLCRGSYGISIDEPLKMNFIPNRRFYYFNPKPWKKSDLENL
ncbi:MAG: hypothetical protein ACR2F2_01370 [Pyrinomonadaceae bacterium]